MLVSISRLGQQYPSGASTGSYEAVELRDNHDEKWNGKGVDIAVSNINGIIKNSLVGIDVSDQEKIDKIMLDLDGSPNKSKLGANAILGVSLHAYEELQV